MLRRSIPFWNTGKRGGASGADPTAFIYTVNTANTLSGSSASDQIRLLLFGSGMDFTVDWGDGTTDYITSSTLITHTYPAPGIYDITWTGANMLGFRVSNNSDRNKFIEVKQWGDLQISVNSMFYGCANLDITATDVPKIITSNLSQMFRNASSLIFNSSINNWDFGITADNPTGVTSLQFWALGASLFNQPMNDIDMSTVSVFEGMLYNTSYNYPVNSWVTNAAITMKEIFRGTPFDQDVSNFNIESLVAPNGLLRFLFGATLSTANYDQLLISWAAQSVDSGMTFDAGGSKYTNSGAALAARNTLISTYGWTINDGGPA